MNILFNKLRKYLSILFVVVFSFTLLGLSTSEVSAQSSTQSIRFNGSKTSRVSVPIAQGGLNIGGGNFTIEFWMKAVSVSAAAPCSGGNDVFTNGALIIDRDIYNEGDNGDFGISLMSDRRLAFSVNNGSNGATACSSTLNLNQWYYIAAVKQGNSIRIYVNGSQTGSNTYSGQINLSYRIGRTTSYPADPYFVFGAEKHTAIGGESFTAYHYNGFLDELRISNIARSITAVSSPFSVDGNTVAMFRFEGSASSSSPSISGSASGISYSNDIPSFAVATAQPTSTPTSNPTTNPTTNPTSNPTSNPTQNPTSTRVPAIGVTTSPTNASISPGETSSSPTNIATQNPTSTPTSTPTNSSEESNDVSADIKNENNQNTIILIALLCILALIIIGIGLYFYYRKRRKKETITDVR